MSKSYSGVSSFILLALAFLLVKLGVCIYFVTCTLPSNQNNIKIIISHCLSDIQLVIVNTACYQIEETCTKAIFEKFKLKCKCKYCLNTSRTNLSWFCCIVVTLCAATGQKTGKFRLPSLLRLKGRSCLLQKHCTPPRSRAHNGLLWSSESRSGQL